MKQGILFLTLLLIPVLLPGQERAMEAMLSDSSMIHASVSLSITDAVTGEAIYEYFPDKNLIPASILKIVTSSAAIELLGPDHSFRTILGYTGTLNRRTGRLKGDIIIKGGGDPVLGSQYFGDHYPGFPESFLKAILETGIKQVDGSIITDDSFYDYQPIPAGWLWEDIGNYYGSGVYGLSVFDNTFKIHLQTFEENSFPVITRIVPEECRTELVNMLVASGNTDEGYVFSSPYGSYTWITGSIPARQEDFVLKASVPDPPLLFARMIDSKLDSAGVIVLGKPTTSRIEKGVVPGDLTIISELVSPPLREIIEVLNHESVNLIAEHLMKEIGRTYGKAGSTEEGIDAVVNHLTESGVTGGVFLRDGSGLSPMNSLSSKAVTDLLSGLRKNGKYFDDFYNSLPEAGTEGTLRGVFTDPVFYRNLRAKSGSMTRVRSYAGFFRTRSGRDIVFCIIINNFDGPSRKIIRGIEGIMKETILNE